MPTRRSPLVDSSWGGPPVSLSCRNLYHTSGMDFDHPLQAAYELALESSGTLGGVAIGCGGRLIETRSFHGRMSHARELLPTIDSLCRDHKIDPPMISQVYVSMGPGSFTGLRIGIAVARMLAFGVGAKVVGVPTLEVIAQNAAEVSDPPKKVAVILDAKRGRVYAATYIRRGSVYMPDAEPAEAHPGPFLAGQSPDCAVLGEGIAHYRREIEASGLRVLPDEYHWPQAETVYRLGCRRASRGEFHDPRTLIPVYIRPPEAEEKWRQQDSEPQP